MTLLREDTSINSSFKGANAGAPDEHERSNETVYFSQKAVTGDSHINTTSQQASKADLYMNSLTNKSISRSSRLSHKLSPADKSLVERGTALSNSSNKFQRTSSEFKFGLSKKQKHDEASPVKDSGGGGGGGNGTDISSDLKSTLKFNSTNYEKNFIDKVRKITADDSHRLSVRSNRTSVHTDAAEYYRNYD